MSSRSRRAALLGLFILAGTAACRRVGDPPVDTHATDPLEIPSAVRGEVDHTAPQDAPAGAHDEPAALDAPSAPLPFVPSELVRGRSGPGGGSFSVALRTSEEVGHQRVIGRRTFAIAMRSEKLTHYPCTSCHAAARPVARPQRVPDAHQDIQPVHPAANNARCDACHVVGNPEWLSLVGAEPVPLNESFKLCAQCHFIQVEAWAGGAHGKRLDTWRGSRVVMACTDCHNPHRPGIPTRIPFPGPRVPRTGPRQP